MLRFYLSKTRLSLQLVFELSWEYYLLDNEQYYKTAKTHHLSQLRISRIIKIKIKLIIHYYMEFFLSRFTGRGGAERVCAPLPFARSPARTLSPFARTRGRTLTRHRLPFAPPLWCAHPSVCPLPPPGLHATPLAHSPPLHARRGALLPVTGSLSCPRFGVPALPFACCPRPGCMPPRSHTLPLARTRGRTVALSHPRCGAPTHPFTCGSPAWVVPRPACMPFARMRGHHGDGAGCTILRFVCPLPLRATLPLARIPPSSCAPGMHAKGEGVRVGQGA